MLDVIKVAQKKVIFHRFFPLNGLKRIHMINIELGLFYVIFIVQFKLFNHICDSISM